MSRIKDEIISSKDIIEEVLYLNKEHKLGRIYNAEIILKKRKRKVAVRTIEFKKVPSYLLENVYLEMGFYKEEAYSTLVPVIALSCEPPKIHIVTLWYQTSLHQYIYKEEHTSKENIEMIK